MHVGKIFTCRYQKYYPKNSYKILLQFRGKSILIRRFSKQVLLFSDTSVFCICCLLTCFHLNYLDRAKTSPSYHHHLESQLSMVIWMLSNDGIEMNIHKIVCSQLCGSTNDVLDFYCQSHLKPINLHIFL